MHAEIAGTGEFLAENDADGIRLAREVFRQLPWNHQGNPLPARKWSEPLQCGKLLVSYPKMPCKPYDVREIMVRIADDSRYLDYKPDYDSQTVCGFIHIHGHSCGSFETMAPSSAKAAKASQFIQFCEQNNIAILFSTTPPVSWWGQIRTKQGD